MRASAAIAQETLTAEAANVVKHSISDAQRRAHTQVTPLHVASSLLTIHGSVLRQACLQSHLHLPHPLQCRALDLCFNVALDRLPASSLHTAVQPSLSNALVAALKRAQAHQRRGCPEQQQVPLLAVKVEMEQLILSILDDPSVSRVMREAGFSSTLVKLSLEEAMGTSAHQITIHSPTSADFSHLKSAYPGSGSYMLKQTVSSLSKDGLAVFEQPFRSNHANLFMPERQSCHRSSLVPSLLQKSSDHAVGGCREKDVNALIDILLRAKKRNPVVVGEPAPTHAIIKELLQRLEKGEVNEKLKKVKPVFPQFSTGHHSKEEMEQKLCHLKRDLDKSLCSGVIVFLGDLQWLLQESTAGNFLAYNSSQHAAMELGRLLMLHGGSGKLWLLGTATSHTYLRCQACYPALEQQWGLQPLPISSGSNVSLSPRLDRLQSTAESYDLCMDPKSAWFLSKPPSSLSNHEEDNSEELSCCPDCLANFETEYALFQEHEMTSNQESVHSCSSPIDIVGKKSQSVADSVLLPTWLQVKSDMNLTKVGGCIQDLRRKWNYTCRTRHAEFHGPEKSTASFPHEPASSSSHKAGTGKTPSKGSSFLSLDSHGGALDKAWLSLQPHPIQECIPSETGEASENDVLEFHPSVKSDRYKVTDAVYSDNLHLVMGRTAVEKGSSRSSGERHENHDSEERHENQRSELTVQTDLALGRSKTAVAGSIGDGNNCFKGRIACLNQSLESRGSNRKTLTASTEANPMSALQEMFRALPVSHSSNVELSNGSGKIKHQNLSGQLSKQDSEALTSLQSNLEEKIPWQKEAINAVASTIVQCRSGMGKRRGMSFKGDTWLLFVGPDQISKRKIAIALADGCEKKFIWFCLNVQNVTCPPPSLGNLQPNVDENGVPHRGRSLLERIVAAVRAKPCAVLLLEDIDKADIVIRRELGRGMQRGKLRDSNGREVSLASSIIVMTSSVGSNLCSVQQSNKKLCFSEERLQAALGCTIKILLEDAARTGRCIMTHRQLSVMEYTSLGKQGVVTSGEPTQLKRKADWHEPACETGEKRSKALDKGQGLELDLNLPVSQFEHVLESDEGFATPLSLATSQEETFAGTLISCVHQSLTKDFCSLCDEVVIFQSFNFDEISNNILDLLSRTVSSLTALHAAIEIDIAVVEHLVAATWEGRCNQVVLENWAKVVLGQTLSNLIENNKISADMTVKLVSEKECLLPEECFLSPDAPGNCVSHLPKHISTNCDS
ncbi:hypothetical protein O6H91_07G131300 [Diphasiastrum complanatum]|uniref:Uncharacterized protein n=2 Tax=Diphasiastrum complanatum TaxID=34168 RepID=A0ACC2D9W8_DIPCM|nr:hypothetical protein O6H91_07G130000 [Diphasiastrum complanatum]KAJ7551043.1 hypothetical protein O6H91_07G131300 [Diphasiastrum complanatum]